MTTPTSPTPEQGMSEEQLSNHMENIKFMKALYGHCKAYVECMPGDKGAINLPGTNKWITELDVKIGVEWQIRSMNFKIRDWLYTQKISFDFLTKITNWLFEKKNDK